VASQWAKGHDQYRFDHRKAEGHVAVRDVTAKQSTDDNLDKVTACIDASKVKFVDKDGKSGGCS
jgi:hypothetical protein